MAEKNVCCFNCEKISSFSHSISFRAVCENCDTDLHICKNCAFYDESSYNECKESSADKVNDKEKRNVCEYFSPNKESSKNKESKEDFLKKAEALFKKKKSP